MKTFQGSIFIITRASCLSTELGNCTIPFLFSDKKQQREKTTMKEIITLVKGYIDDLVHLMISFVAIGAVSEVIFGTGVFGVNVIGNLTLIINKFGESGFAGLVALLVLVGLFRK